MMADRAVIQRSALLLGFFGKLAQPSPRLCTECIDGFLSMRLENIRKCLEVLCCAPGTGRSTQSLKTMQNDPQLSNRYHGLSRCSVHLSGSFAAATLASKELKADTVIASRP